MNAIEKLWEEQKNQSANKAEVAEKEDEWNSHAIFPQTEEVESEELSDPLDALFDMLDDNDNSVVKDEEDDHDERIRQRLIFLENEFGFSEREVKSFVGPMSAIFTCSEAEIKEKIPYFIELFESADNFKAIMEESEIRPIGYYKGILSYKKKELIAEKLDAIGMLFKTDKAGAIALARASSYYIYYSSEQLLRQRERIAEMFRISCDECIELVKKFPYIMRSKDRDLQANDPSNVPLA